MTAPSTDRDRTTNPPGTGTVTAVIGWALVLGGALLPGTGHRITGPTSSQRSLRGAA